MTQVSLKNKTCLVVMIDDREYALQLPDNARAGEALDVCLIFANELQKSIQEKAQLLKEKNELEEEKKEVSEESSEESSEETEAV